MPAAHRHHVGPHVVSSSHMLVLDYTFPATGVSASVSHASCHLTACAIKQSGLIIAIALLISHIPVTVCVEALTLQSSVVHDLAASLLKEAAHLRTRCKQLMRRNVKERQRVPLILCTFTILCLAITAAVPNRIAQSVWILSSQSNDSFLDQIPASVLPDIPCRLHASGALVWVN